MFVIVICYTKIWSQLTNMFICYNLSMKKDTRDYKFCINVAIENAKNRIKLLDKMEQKCIMEEYKEWIRDGLDYQSVLLLREDPIIWKLR